MTFGEKSPLKQNTILHLSLLQNLIISCHPGVMQNMLKLEHFWYTGRKFFIWLSVKYLLSKSIYVITLSPYVAMFSWFSMKIRIDSKYLRRNFSKINSGVCWIFFKKIFSKNLFRNTFRVSNSLESDQAGHIVGPDLGPNCLQKLSADDTVRWRVKVRRNLKMTSAAKSRWHFTCLRTVLNLEHLHRHYIIMVNMCSVYEYALFVV